jgi:hypothetical protein
MLHYGMREIGSTLDLYGIYFNKKHHSSSFNTKPAWAEFILKEKFGLTSG